MIVIVNNCCVIDCGFEMVVWMIIEVSKLWCNVWDCCLVVIETWIEMFASDCWNVLALMDGIIMGLVVIGNWLCFMVVMKWLWLIVVLAW